MALQLRIRHRTGKSIACPHCKKLPTGHSFWRDRPRYWDISDLVNEVALRHLRFYDGSQGLGSSRIVEEDLWLVQCGEAIPHGCDLEGAHGWNNW
jgi:hypothetical protein